MLCQLYVISLRDKKLNRNKKKNEFLYSFHKKKAKQIAFSTKYSTSLPKYDIY